MSQLAVPPFVPTASPARDPLPSVPTDTQLRNRSLPAGGEVGRQIDQPTERPTDQRSLARVARRLAEQADVWRPLLHVDPDRRWYTRLTVGDGWEAWLLTWLPGQGTDLHDHGGSSGAFTVLQGRLEELTPAPTSSDPTRLVSRVLQAPQVRAFGSRHVHQVIGVGDTPAASLHVYSPALTVMNRYRLDRARGPVVVETDRAGADW